MIGRLTGKILEKNPPEILLEVGGIGYEILCPMSSFYEMGESNSSHYTRIFTLKKMLKPYTASSLKMKKLSLES